ncbi:unnamed protein product [Prorocentrum cordatum]|uniref:Uncharacterized protein n=1 Tax=Prorocentrum cordatum TaxID=2364126 RepID=A0ABN9T5J4_9DINO|nr:unnamed protein product [Polarella glacialis]
MTANESAPRSFYGRAASQGCFPAEGRFFECCCGEAGPRCWRGGRHFLRCCRGRLGRCRGRRRPQLHAVSFAPVLRRRVGPRWCWGTRCCAGWARHCCSSGRAGRPRAAGARSSRTRCRRGSRSPATSSARCCSRGKCWRIGAAGRGPGAVPRRRGHARAARGRGGAPGGVVRAGGPGRGRGRAVVRRLGARGLRRAGALLPVRAVGPREPRRRRGTSCGARAQVRARLGPCLQGRAAAGGRRGGVRGGPGSRHAAVCGHRDMARPRAQRPPALRRHGRRGRAEKASDCMQVLKLVQTWFPGLAVVDTEAELFWTTETELAAREGYGVSEQHPRVQRTKAKTARLLCSSGSPTLEGYWGDGCSPPMLLGTKSVPFVLHHAGPSKATLGRRCTAAYAMEFVAKSDAWEVHDLDAGTSVRLHLGSAGPLAQGLQQYRGNWTGGQRCGGLDGRH